jgi:hypothetical protein
MMHMKNPEFCASTLVMTLRNAVFAFARDRNAHAARPFTPMLPDFASRARWIAAPRATFRRGATLFARVTPLKTSAARLLPRMAAYFLFGTLLNASVKAIFPLAALTYAVSAHSSVRARLSFIHRPCCFVPRPMSFPGFSGISA